MKKIEGYANANDAPDVILWAKDQLPPGLTKPALLLIAEDGEQLPEVPEWIKCSDRLPPIHEEPFPEEGFVLILLQCEDWPNKYKTMKASRTIGDWADDGSPMWFWTDEEGEIIDDDDNLITHWQPIPKAPHQ